MTSYCVYGQNNNHNTHDVILRLLPWLSKLYFCLCRDVARETFEGWTSGAFLLILGEFLGTFIT